MLVTRKGGNGDHFSPILSSNSYYVEKETAPSKNIQQNQIDLLTQPVEDQWVVEANFDMVEIVEESHYKQ